MRFLLLTTLILALSFAVFGQNWLKIQPVESTLSDVEKVLGKAEVRGYSTRHYLDDGIYQIQYSDGKCNPEWEQDWLIPEWKVFEIFYSFRESPKVSSLGLNLNKLKKTINSPHTPGIFDYTDENQGITYTVQRDFDLKANVVTNIKIFPAKKYGNIICRNTKSAVSEKVAN